MLHYVNLSNSGNFSASEYRGARASNALPLTHFYGQDVKKGGRASLEAQQAFSWDERDWFSWRNYSYAPYPGERQRADAPPFELVHRPPTPDFARFYWGGPGVAERDDPTPYRCERPKVLHNLNTPVSSASAFAQPRTQGRATFVMWFAQDDYLQTRLLAGVAVADFPGGPFFFSHSLRPDTNETTDLTLMQDADSGAAFLVRTHYATTSFWLPDPIMQPVWESIKLMDQCAPVNGVEVCATDYGLTYHRAFYDAGYDNPDDIWQQRWRLEDKRWNISIFKDRFDSTINHNRRETFSADTGNFTLWHFYTCGPPPDGCSCGDVGCGGCCQGLAGDYFEEALVSYGPAQRLAYMSVYFDKYSLRTIAGQGQGGFSPCLDPADGANCGVVTSRFRDPAFPENSKWLPGSVPAVKAQPWAANYREKNVADNPIMTTVADLLIGPNNVVEQRRAKYVTISRLTDDYLNTTGTLTVLEGWAEGDDRLLAVMGEYGRFGWTVGGGGATGAAGAPALDADASLLGPSLDGRSTYQPDVYGRVAPFGFDVEADWDSRHWQYNRSWNDRELDFRNFRDRVTDSACQDLHHLVLIKQAECQDIMNHDLRFVVSPPQKNYLEQQTSYSYVMDSVAYTKCLEQLQGFYDAFGVYQLGIQQAYEDCVRSRVPDLEALPDWSPGARSCVGGGGACGQPADGALPQVAYGFPPFDAAAASARAVAAPFFPGGVAPGAFEPDLTNISVRAWATHNLTQLDLGRRQRGTDASTPSYYGTSLGGQAPDAGGEPNYYSTRAWEAEGRAQRAAAAALAAAATHTASASTTGSPTATASPSSSHSPRTTRTSTRTSTASATATATASAVTPSRAPSP